MDQSNIHSDKKPTVRYRDLFTSFFKIGVFTFGGGYAMVPLIEQEVVEKRGWIEMQEFKDLLTVAQSIPGPIALNSAAFIGYKSRGYSGALASLLGIVVPSFVIIMVVAIFFSSIRHNPIVEAAFKAMRPVVVALIVAPTIAFMRGMKPLMIVVTFASMALIALNLCSPAALILAAIVVGVIWTFKLQNAAKK